MKKLLCGLLAGIAVNVFAEVGYSGILSKYNTYSFHSENNEIMIKYQQLKKMTGPVDKRNTGYISDVQLCNGTECKAFHFKPEQMTVWAYGVNLASFEGHTESVGISGQICAQYTSKWCVNSISLKLDNTPTYMPHQKDAYELTLSEKSKVSFEQN